MSEQRERELAEEIEFHRAMQGRKYREQGISGREAAYKVKRDFGGFEKWKEVCRDVGRVRIMDELWCDFVLAVRMLWNFPLFRVAPLGSARARPFRLEAEVIRLKGLK